LYSLASLRILIASSLVEYSSITRDSLLTSSSKSCGSVTRMALSMVNLNVSCMSEILSLTACMKSSWPAICEVTTLNWCHLYLSRILSIAAVWCSSDGASCSCRLLCDARYKPTEFPLCFVNVWRSICLFTQTIFQFNFNFTFICYKKYFYVQNKKK